MDGLATPRLLFRRWREGDGEVFHRLNADPGIMRFFHFRQSRAEADETMRRWNAGLDENGMSFLALERREDGRVVGTLGLSPVSEPIYDFAPTVQIGWRLLPDATGFGYATEGAEAALAFGFERLEIPEIVAQCVVANRASEAVMRRIGLRRRSEFDHPKVPPDTHPHLVRHSLYALTRTEWLGRRARGKDSASGTPSPAESG